MSERIKDEVYFALKIKGVTSALPFPTLTWLATSQLSQSAWSQLFGMRTMRPRRRI